MRRGFGGRLEYLYCLQSLITIFLCWELLVFGATNATWCWKRDKRSFRFLVLQTQHGLEKETRGAFGFLCYKHNRVLKDKRSFWFFVLQTQHGVEKETRGAFGFWCYKHNMVLKKRQEELLDFGATNTTWC
jgi:hypothetical protein